jgi:FkbM family methyltransferase
MSLSALKKAVAVPIYVWRDASNAGQRWRRCAWSLAWQIWKRFVVLPIIVTLDNGMHYVLDPSSGHSAGAVYTRIYEYRLVEFARRHVDPGGTLVDVGAHSGLYTLLLAHLFQRAFLFEPAPDTYRLLCRNLRLNELSAFTSFCEAVGREDAFGQFVITGPNSGTNHLISDPITAAGGAITVPVVALDRQLAGIEDVNYLKIDCEGGELAVLQGATRILATNPQLLIHFESRTNDVGRIVALLEAHDFIVFAVGARQQPDLRSNAIFTAPDLFACGPRHPLQPSLAARRRAPSEQCQLEPRGEPENGSNAVRVCVMHLLHGMGAANEGKKES